MSRAVPEWVGATADTPVPQRVQLRVFLRNGGLCQGCERSLRSGDKPQCDHIKALVNGGENRESNLQMLCGWCHAKKTGRDVAEKSKAHRIIAKHMGIRKPSTFRGWRRFDGSPVFAKERER